MFRLKLSLHQETPQQHVLSAGRVLLADDAEVIRNAVSRLLEAEPTIKVVGVAENFSQTLQMAASLRPDVVLLDLHMPDGHAFQPAFVKSELALAGARVLGMSLSSGEDDEESGCSLKRSVLRSCWTKQGLATNLSPPFCNSEPSGARNRSGAVQDGRF
jgi:CheY-like chemotaxis protein